jgi:alpha-galactosidase
LSKVPQVDVSTRDAPPTLASEEVEPGLRLANVRLELPERATPEPLRLSLRLPLADVFGLWTPDFDPQRSFDRSLQPPWLPFRTSATRGAPVVCAYAQSGENRLTVAFSDARTPATLEAGVAEETGELLVAVTLFELRTAPLQHYEATLRIDTRPVPYHEALNAVQGWWTSVGYAPAPVPDFVREPMYSTWYSFHLGLEADAVEEQCRLAHELGCRAVIVDDGW